MQTDAEGPERNELRSLDSENPPLMTPEEVATALRVHRSWACAHQRELPGLVRLGRYVSFRVSRSWNSCARHFLAKPAVRFYDKVYLGPFSPAETAEYVEAIFTTAANRAEFAQWLYSKTGGHPYFMSFICRQLAGLARGAATIETDEHWSEILEHLEKEEFRADLAHITEREVQLLRALARSDEEISVEEFDERYERVYFSRLTGRALLMRTGRGRYKLYHPLFRLFLMRET